MMNSIDTPFHEGEQIVQDLAGVSQQMQQRMAAVISPRIPKAALSFIEERCLVVISSLDTGGYPWASVLVGEPGFVRAQNDHTVILDNRSGLSSVPDPVWNNIQQGADIGMLVIDLGTRRRLRINGHIRRLDAPLNRLDDQVYELTVEQAYPNCPKYIQKRQISIASYPASMSPGNDLSGNVLEEAQINLVKRADTFFVASANPGHGLDASHRGGNPGFVQYINNDRLRIPDYRGNNLFNTLGNFTAYPLAGLVFIDFERSRCLQITGKVRVLWDQEEPDHVTGGTHRYWELTIIRWIETQLPRKLLSQWLEASPHNPVEQSNTI